MGLEISHFNGCALQNLFFKINGLNGAMNIVRILKQRGVQLLFVMDEGLTILDGIIPGLEGPAAL